MNLRCILTFITLLPFLFALAQPSVLNVNPAFTAGEMSADSTRFTSLREALLTAEKLQKQYSYTESSPLTIRISPSVYWLDDPDDTAVRNPAPGVRPKVPTAISPCFTLWATTYKPKILLSATIATWI